MIAVQQTDSRLMQQLKRLEPFIGKTPLFPIRNIYYKPGIQIFAKLEWQQFGGSIKTRPAFNIIKEAVFSGELHRDKILLDATSGNTGIAYASIGAALGIRVTLYLPKNASEERKTILKSLGAEIIYTSPFGGTDEAQQAAKELYERNREKYFYANQYANAHNWHAHYDGTGEEIFRETFGTVTHFSAGLGTTGTFTGVGKRLRSFSRKIQLIGLQPETVLHGLEGWKHLETAIVPRFYDNKLANEIITVPTQNAYDLIKETASAEGMLLSPSSAANLAGAIKVAEDIERGVIVTVFPDNGDKYGDIHKQIFKQ